MSTKKATNLRHLIDTFRILNINDSESTVSEGRFPFQNSFKKESFIVSDVDEEILILVEFHDIVSLTSIKFHALPPSDDNKDEDDEDDADDDDDEEERSPPKEIHIFKIDDLSKDFNDVQEMKKDHSVNCKPNKLAKGQSVNLQKKAKIAVKFKKVRCLAIWIKSNQAETEKTYLSGIIFEGSTDAKLAYDMPTYTDTKKKQKSTEIVAMFDTLDKRKVGLAAMLKSNQSALDFNISNEVIHSLLSYISRLGQSVNSKMYHKIYTNENEFGSKWIATLKIYDEEKKKFKIENKGLSAKDYSKNTDEIYDEKMSFALMKILCIDECPKEIKLFLLKKMEFIMFHCMLVFHPASQGNIYHSIDILTALLQYYPLKVYEIITRPTQNGDIIQTLFKYAITSFIHHSKFNAFLLSLLLFNKSEKQKMSKLRTSLVHLLKNCNFIQNLIEIGSNPNIYGDDIANEYISVLITLLKQSATMSETAPLFMDNKQNILCLIVDKLMKGALDKKENGKWYRINCVDMAIFLISDLSDVNVVEMKRKKIIKSSKNYLYDVFNNGVLDKMKEFVSLIVDEIIDTGSSDVVKTTRMATPLGLYRLKCFELLMVYVRLAVKRKIAIDIKNMNVLCKGLIQMALTHVNNNLFLVLFKEFVDVLNGDQYIEYLKYMIVECKMMDKFVQFYNANDVPSALRAFILIIKWEINNRCDGREWYDAIKSKEDIKKLMKVVETQNAIQNQKQSTT